MGQCVTFAVPHPKLGEDVGADVVLKEGQSATDREIRDFAGERLAAFKVPRKILILDEIPKGATRKLQRIGLAEKLGLGGGAHNQDLYFGNRRYRRVHGSEIGTSGR